MFGTFEGEGRSIKRDWGVAYHTGLGHLNFKGNDQCKFDSQMYTKITYYMYLCFHETGYYLTSSSIQPIQSFFTLSYVLLSLFFVCEALLSH